MDPRGLGSARRSYFGFAGTNDELMGRDNYTVFMSTHDIFNDVSLFFSFLPFLLSFSLDSCILTENMARINEAIPIGTGRI